MSEATETCTRGRRILDADSHVMETLDGLTAWAKPGQEDLISVEATLACRTGVGEIEFEGRRAGHYGLHRRTCGHL
jgi:hypothetical protein